MGLRERDYTRNSKGESVLIKEIGWAEANENPTHMILQFSSSHGGLLSVLLEIHFGLTM